VRRPDQGAASRKEFTMSTRFPSLFLSHGGPSVLIDGSPAPAAWRNWAASHPVPRAVVMLSAHRPALAPTVSSFDTWRTVHDFRGFPAELYQLSYPAPGDATLAEQLRARLAAAGIAVEADHRDGLDHGAWVPLLAMYPEHQVPVVALSVLPRADAATHYALGQALAGLADEGILVIGSGSLTHNLYEVMWNDSEVPGWVSEFRDWMLARLAEGDLAALLDWQARAPYAAENHPTDEHLLPLFFALGAGGTASTLFHGGVEHRSVAMDALAFGG